MKMETMKVIEYCLVEDAEISPGVTLTIPCSPVVYDAPGLKWAKSKLADFKASENHHHNNTRILTRVTTSTPWELFK